jgi:hypothetical protein
MIAGMLMLAMAAGSPLFAQTNADQVAQLEQRVAQLEKQVQEISKVLEPVRAQQAVDNRRRALREKFEQRRAQDRDKYTPEQLREAEELTGVADQKWGSPEGIEGLKTIIKKYPDSNRAGCSTLYLAQLSQGEERAKYFQDCIGKYNDCFYGDGVQVGAFARLLLAQDCRNNGDGKKAEALENEIKTQYADAVGHNGNLLVDSLKADSK